ncbi:MAG: alkaline shock response membrane anchor protein AmaP [Candidatus Omnitrophica bacterium]|nr:alkaline shock response membrane anchor protein AmaP [Candidatus Omnitrophota bacterium]
MRIFTKVLGFVYILTGLTAMFFLSLVYIKPGIITISKNLLEQELPKFGIGGFSLILIGIIWFIYWSDYKIRTKNIIFNNPHGKVKISLRAIEEFVSVKITTHIKNVKTVRVKASIGSRGLETAIYLNVPGGYNIPELSTQIQELIKNYLQDVVGVDRVSNIHIGIQSIVSEPQTTPASDEGKNGKRT